MVNVKTKRKPPRRRQRGNLIGEMAVPEGFPLLEMCAGVCVLLPF